MSLAVASSPLQPLTLAQAMAAYLDVVRLARSHNTARTYAQALRAFQESLRQRDIDPDTTPLVALDEAWLTHFARDLKDLAPATEQLYLTATRGFYAFVAANWRPELNMERIKFMLRQHSRRPGPRLPQFPYQAIEQVLTYAQSLKQVAEREEDPRARLRLLRDRAFLLTLADTGLRVHEACGLRRGDIDWESARALVVGKGNRQDVVRFSPRALDALQDYLRARALLDGSSGRPLAALPVFARHDKRAGKRVLPISTVTGRDIVRQRVQEALGPEAAGTITPHSFRHYFVTRVLKGSGGNLKLAQVLARHRNIQVTQRYAHLSDDELDRAYAAIFRAGDDASVDAGRG